MFEIIELMKKKAKISFHSLDKAFYKNKKLVKQFEKIAVDQLLIETLETRNRDCLDFPEVCVAGIRTAMYEAYLQGQIDAEKRIKAKIKKQNISK